MSRLLTGNRIEAMAHISRWGGWVKRRFSVLDHTVIGAILAEHMQLPAEVIRAWLLHDVEETEFMGDVPTPIKERYCSAQYYLDVSDFVARLYSEAGVDLAGTLAQVKRIDEIMKRAEFATVSLKTDDEPRFDPLVTYAMTLISHGPTVDMINPTIFWSIWTRHAPVRSDQSNVIGLARPPSGHTH